MAEIFFKKFNKKNSGFTILETMIAVSLFIVIVMTGMNALLNASLIGQKSKNMRSIIDNLSFIMEDMSKNLRTGYHYHCFSGGDVISAAVASIAKSCPSGWGLAFESADGLPGNIDDQWVYYIGTYNGTVGIFKSVDGGANFVQLNPDEVVIDTTLSTFSVLGAESPANGDTQEPFVTIRLVGTITFKGIVTSFNLQTSVSQRLIDV
jgi:Tfp pilus assembly protein PilW